MSARVRATSWLSGERVRATVNMLVERDGRLRFEAEVSLQGTVATLATDGNVFALLDARKNELSRGPACPANVASLIRIPLAPADVAAILLGDARPPDQTGAAPTVDWDAAAGADVLSLPDPAGGALQILVSRHRRGSPAGRRQPRRRERRPAVADRRTRTSRQSGPSGSRAPSVSRRQRPASTTASRSGSAIARSAPPRPPGLSRWPRRPVSRCATSAAAAESARDHF